MSGQSQHETAAAATPCLLDVVLFPHRSLSPRGFRILIGSFAAASFVAGVICVSIGAWPVFGFFGLDVLLLAWCFRRSYRDARFHETLRLEADRLTVERVTPSGARSAWTFQPYWLRVELDEPATFDSQLALASHGRRLVIGTFLTPEEKSDLAATLRGALARLRQPPTA